MSSRIKFSVQEIQIKQYKSKKLMIKLNKHKMIKHVFKQKHIKE